MKKFVKPTNPKKARTSQPSKDSTNSTKKRTSVNTKNTTETTKQKVFKSQKIVPTKSGSIKDTTIRRNDTPKERKHPEYGTSKLEEKFAKDFLDKLGIVYETQFKAETIGRYYDFYCPASNTLLEIDGGYWHSDPRLFEGKELTPTQKKNKRVDECKDKWAREHGINLIRIWEYDINKNPSQVLKMLKEKLSEYSLKFQKEQEKKQRPKKK